MTTTLERPAVNAGIRKTREFSRWHEACMEHLLLESGLTITYEPLMSGKTPDLLVRAPGGAPFIIECIARLPDPEHADEMERTGCHVCNGNIGDLHANVYSRLAEALDHNELILGDLMEQGGIPEPFIAKEKAQAVVDASRKAGLDAHQLTAICEAMLWDEEELQVHRPVPKTKTARKLLRTAEKAGFDPGAVDQMAHFLQGQ